MIGAIIGDIVGSRFEYKNTNKKDFELFTPECGYTDDTVCTVAVADAIMNGGNYKNRMLKWCRKYPNPKGYYGASFAYWINSIDPKPYNSYGNGSAMRVSPCGWRESLTDALKCAEKSACITHNHTEGIKGALCVSDIIWSLRNGHTKWEIRKKCILTYNYDVDIELEELRKTNIFNETCQVTVPQAIACFLQSSDFEDTIRSAVSIGGDSDTIAAIAGSIAEAYYPIADTLKTEALEFLPDDMIEVIKQFQNKIKNQL